MDEAKNKPPVNHISLGNAIIVLEVYEIRCFSYISYMEILKQKKEGILCFILAISTVFICADIYSQDSKSDVWNNKKCAVVLTYDDALGVHLDNVLPLLDSLGLKATFYIPGKSETLNSRLTEWRVAANNGHELGNHTLFHPCAGLSKGREWVSSEYDLDNYTYKRLVDELRLNNTLLKAIDGRNDRTFAYPCGDKTIESINYMDSLKNEFIGARGVEKAEVLLNNIDLYNIPAYGVRNNTGDDLIELVDEALNSGYLRVFLFHGIGGGHNINVSSEEHKKLLVYLKDNEKNIWIAPLIDVVRYVREIREHE